MEDSKVASMLCVGADCSTNLDFQNGPPTTLAGSPTGRPMLSPDHTTGSGTVSPLLPPSDEVEHCHSEKLMSVKQLPGQSGASFEVGSHPSRGLGSSSQNASWASVVGKRAFGVGPPPALTDILPPMGPGGSLPTHQHSSDKVGGGDSNSPGLPVPPIPEPTTPELASLAPSISATEPEYQVFPMAVPGYADGADGGCAPVVWVVPVLGLWPGISCCCISPCRCKIAFVGLCYLLEANWPTGSRQVFSSLVVESAVLLVLLPDACIAGLGVWSVADVLLAGIVLNLGGSFDAYPVDSSFGWAMLCCLSVMGSCKRGIQLLPSVVIPKIVFPALVGVIFLLICAGLVDLEAESVWCIAADTVMTFSWANALLCGSSDVRVVDLVLLLDVLLKQSGYYMLLIL
ncbi:hypothetical protein Nepgr_018002 [Nepenthes gracilis]|uniref:Uncharacterized protein n=1 Tax=Nepenthes gracilis TaxID=150966 RepID=A0AAD3STZ8_NEPGR|nr:hypothetical protein Nepgr_018002 [Nepenthes gracilis]